VTLGDVTSWANTGNIVTSVQTLLLGLNAGGAAERHAAGRAGRLHLVPRVDGAGLPLPGRVLRLRAVAIKQASGPPPRRVKVRESAAQRVGDDPMLWKEAFAKIRVRSGWLAQVGAAILVGGPLLPGLGMVGMASGISLDIGLGRPGAKPCTTGSAPPARASPA